MTRAAVAPGALAGRTDSSAQVAGAGRVVALDAASFAARIGGQSFAIVDFWARWCAPCRAFAPVFEAAAARHPDLLFATVDTEQQQALAADFGIRSIPTLLIVRDDIIVFVEAGALSAAALDEVISAARALDMAEVRRAIADQQDAPSGHARKTLSL